jgi:hypothetical protein
MFRESGLLMSVGGGIGVFFISGTLGILEKSMPNRSILAEFNTNGL